jgi:D-glycero-alpha-D-manno-heptose 1-phosphate guanylyltransferase
MEAVVLAGGFGTRLRAVVPDWPKPMAPVAGRPFLEILLSTLAAKGFKRAVLSLGHMAEKISGHFGPRFAGLELVYEVEHSPLGTGGAMRQALPHIQGDHAYVFNGDTFLDLEVAQLEAHWHLHQRPIIVARDVPDTARYGRLHVEHGRLLGFAEKGAAGPGLINAGCYVLPRAVLQHMAAGMNFSFETDFLAKVVPKQHMDVFVTQGLFIDIGVPTDYEMAQSLLAVTVDNL